MAGGSGRGVEHPLPPTPPARRHCWVTGPDGAPHAGVIVAWDKHDGAWWAQVAYVVESDDALVTQWLAAALLRPVR